MSNEPKLETKPLTPRACLEIAEKSLLDLAESIEEGDLSEADKIEFFDTYEEDIAKMLRAKANDCRELMRKW